MIRLWVMKFGEETAQACVNAIYRQLLEKSALQSRGCHSNKTLLIFYTVHPARGEPITTPACPDPTSPAVTPDKLPTFLDRPWVTITGVILLLLVLEGQLLYSVRQESLTWDEGDHIFAGYMSLKHHDFGLNP